MNLGEETVTLDWTMDGRARCSSPQGTLGGGGCFSPYGEGAAPSMAEPPVGRIPSPGLGLTAHRPSLGLSFTICRGAFGLSQGPRHNGCISLLFSSPARDP